MHNTVKTNQTQFRTQTTSNASSSTSALTNATTVTPLPSISANESSSVPASGARQTWRFKQTQSYIFNETEALDEIARKGLIGAVRGRTLRVSYFRPFRTAKRDFEATHGPHEFNHIVPQAKLMKAITKMLTEFEDLNSRDSTAQFASTFIALCDKHGMRMYPGHLQNLLNATTVDELKEAAETWVWETIVPELTIYVGQVAISRKEAVQRMIETAMFAHAQSPESLRKALLYIVLDNSAERLFERLKNNILNIFAHKLRPEEIAGPMMAVLRELNPSTIDAIHSSEESSQSLREVMEGWLDNMKTEFPKAMQSSVKSNGKEADTEKMQDSFNELHDKVLSPWVHSVCSDEIPTSEKRKQLENLVRWSADSFQFETAAGPHRSLNRIMNRSMAAVYPKFEEFIAAPRGEKIDLFFEAVDEFLEAQTDLLNGLGVVETDHFVKLASSTPLVSHILFDTPLPDGFAPLPGTISIRTPNNGEITISFDKKVTAIGISEEAAIGLMAAARAAMAEPDLYIGDEKEGTGQASFVCGGKDYQLTYDHAKGEITNLEIEGPGKDGHMQLLVRYPSNTNSNVEQTEPQTKGKASEPTGTTRTKSVTSPTVTPKSTASAATTKAVSALHSTGAVKLQLPVNMNKGKGISQAMAIGLVNAAIDAMGRAHGHYRQDGNGSGQAEFECDGQAYILSYRYEEERINVFDILRQDGTKNKEVKAVYLAAQ